MITFLLALMQDMIPRRHSAVGFAMVFNALQRALPWCVLLGAIGQARE